MYCMVLNMAYRYVQTKMYLQRVLIQVPMITNWQVIFMAFPLAKKNKRK